MKLFGTGLQRTGCMSLTRALNMLGFPTRQFAPELHRNIHHEVIERFQGFTDFPIPLHYQELDAAYPGSKFIHTLRDETAWLKSVEWLFTVGAVKFNWHANPIFDRVHQDFYGTVAFDPNRFLQRYRNYNAEVLAYFQGRPDDFLLVDLPAGDGFDRICPFLGVPVPPQPFPVSNQSEALPRVIGRRWLHKLKNRQ